MTFTTALIIIGVIILILLLFKLYLVLTTGRCTSTTQMYGKTVIVTGATSGIGKATALDLANRGARVILACRNLELAQKTKEEIVLQTTNSNIAVYHLDLESLDSVRQFSKNVHENESRLDVLINNAGAVGLGSKKTADGLLATMQVNHLSPFLLTNLLLDLLIQSAPSRIATVSSLLYIISNLDPNDLNKDKTILTFDAFNYANSKLCNILMSNELAAKLKGTKVTSNCLHPGAVRTNALRHARWFIRFWFWFGGIFFNKDPKTGAQTTIHVAVCEKVNNITGRFFAECKETFLPNKFKNRELSTKVWNQSMNLVGLKHSDVYYSTNERF